MRRSSEKTPASAPRPASWRWWLEASLFSAVIIAIILRFGGFLIDETPPGWDLPGHYYAFLKMGQDYLPHGHVTGYLPEWLGGIALFQYYAPLLFIVMAVIWLAIGKIIPIALFFRLSAFLVLFLMPAAIWFFARVFLGRRAALWSLALTPVFVFYPKFYSALGIGAGSVLWVGLFPGALGTTLVFVVLALAELLRQKPAGRLLPVLVSLSVAALASGHTVSLIIGTLMFAVYGLVHIKERAFLFRLGIAYAVGIVLAAWWLLPFAAGNYLTATEVRGLADMNTPSFFLYFPLLIPYLNIAAALLAAAFICGLWALATRKRWDLLVMLVTLGAMFMGRRLVSWAFPAFTIHYERLFPFIYFLIVIVAADAFRKLQEKWSEVAPRSGIYLAITAAMIAGFYFLMFDFKTEFHLGDEYVRQPLLASWNDFVYADEGKEIVSLLGKEADVGRVYAEMPTADAQAYLGSYEYFDVELPLINRQETIGGLYVESSPLTPYLTPTTEALTRFADKGHGDKRLRWMVPFIEEPKRTHLDRLRLLGVSHIIAYTPEFIGALRAESGVGEVGGTEHFRVFRLAATAPVARTAAYKPAVYLNLDGRLPFRDFSMVVFAGEHSFDMPVVDGGRNASVLERLSADGYSFIIASAGGTNDEEMKVLMASGHPLIILGRDQPPGGAGQDAYLVAPEVIPLTITDWRRSWPSGWRELQDAVASLKEKYRNPEASPVELRQLGDRSLSFSAKGPVTLNMGYASYWRTVNSADAAVWQITPAVMLVSGDGERRLRYAPDKLAGFSSALSGLAAVILLVWFVWPRRLRLRRSPSRRSEEFGEKKSEPSRL